MSQHFVKIKEHGSDTYDVDGIYADPHDAEEHKSRLLNGAGGLFGLYHEIWVDTIVPQKARKPNNGKKVRA